MSRTFMDPTVDWAFKYIFSHEAVLRQLLNDLLPVSVGQIEYLSNEIPVQSERDKRSIFDVICTEPGSGRRFIVEMQSYGDTDMDDRIFFYGATLIHSQIRRGDPRYVLNPVYVVCIANYRRPHPEGTPDNKILFRYTFRETETDETYGDQLMICRLELLRLGNPPAEHAGNIEKWAYYLRNMPTFAERPAGAGVDFSPLFDAASLGSLQDKDIKNYYSAMNTEYEMRVGREYSFNEGMQKGMEEGLMQVAKNLLASGTDVAFVAKVTGLSPEVLARLA